MANVINSQHHFESNLQNYTASIVQREKDYPGLLPIIFIQNDNVKDDCYSVDCFTGSACIDGDLSVYADEVDEIQLDEQCNVLDFRLDEEAHEKACKDAYGADYECDEDLLEYGIPCDETLAAFILKTCELEYYADSKFWDIEDFTIED